MKGINPIHNSVHSYLLWIESEIKKQKFGNKPKSLYEPLRYIMSLGGKRLRPLLTLFSYSLFKDDARKIVPMATVVETFHNFTLLHDDIMDNAPLRRGKPAVHKKWGINTAILSGDVMQVKVYDRLIGIGDAHLKEVLIAFNKCATEVCEGQQWDMEFETKHDVTEGRYLEMIRLKTAVLLGFSMELGAILAGASAMDKRSLREFGVLMGMGFQLKDDLLDVYGDENKFGKQVGGDIFANKKTFLLIKSLQKARGKNKRDLQFWLSARKFNRRKKVKAITELYDSLGIREITEQKIAAYLNQSFTCLNKVSVNPERTITLKDFTKTLMQRQV
jgi:geranylgeranyl diphosphate synthase type II